MEAALRLGARKAGVPSPFVRAGCRGGSPFFCQPSRSSTCGRPRKHRPLTTTGSKVADVSLTEAIVRPGGLPWIARSLVADESSAGGRADERIRGEPAARCPTRATSRRLTPASRGAARASSGQCIRLPRAARQLSACGNSIMTSATQGRAKHSPRKGVGRACSRAESSATTTSSSLSTLILSALCSRRSRWASSCQPVRARS